MAVPAEPASRRGRDRAPAGSTRRRLLLVAARAQAAGRVPALVAGVVRDGELVWADGYGSLPGGPVEEVQFRIGSITKTITAVLVLRAVRDGLVALDEPVSTVLGDIGYGDRTPRMLLAHSSGMQAEPPGPWWERAPGRSWAELAGHDGSRDVFAPVFDPGDRYHYSNLGFALLGELVARVRGRSWWETAQQEVLGPLGMSRTTFLPEPPVATGFSVHPYEGALVPEPATDTGAMAPAGQLWSTIGDLARWAGFLIEGRTSVLSQAELARAMTAQASDPEAGLEHAHGLGFRLMRGGSGTLVGHTGSMPGFLAGCFVDRARRTGALVLANGTVGVATGELARDLLEELEECEPALPAPWRPSDPVPAAVADVLGVWHWGNTALVFAWEGSELVVRRDGVVTSRFAVDRSRIVGTSGYHAGEELVVARDESGAVRHLEVATFLHTRTPYDPEAPIPGGPPA